MFILLVGPKGSGKSHIGRTLEKHLGVLFFHVEPLWMSYYAECQAAGREPVISEIITRVHPLLVDALRTHEHVCIETIGASAEILNDLLSLTHRSNTLVVRVCAPMELCLERIVTRDQRNQIAMDVESIRQAHALSEEVQLQPDLTLKTAQLTEAEIISVFRSALTRPSSGQPRQAGSAVRTVRRIRRGEGELYKQMRLASLRESPFAFGATYESAVQRSPESWAEQADGTAQGSDRSTFIAFCGDAPIGIAALYRTGEGSDVGELLQVWVAPEQRSQGVAVDLMDAVFEWAGGNGFRTVVAGVTKENARALRFYEKYGFAPANRASAVGTDDQVVLTKEVEEARTADALPRAGELDS